MALSNMCDQLGFYWPAESARRSADGHSESLSESVYIQTLQAILSKADKLKISFLKCTWIQSMGISDNVV